MKQLEKLLNRTMKAIFNHKDQLNITDCLSALLSTCFEACTRQVRITGLGNVGCKMNLFNHCVLY